MLYALLVAGFFVMLLRDHAPTPALLDVISPLAAIALTLAPMVACVLAQWHSAIVAVRVLDSGQPHRAVMRHDLIQRGAQVATMVAHAAGVLLLGTLDLVRRWMGGDVILLDEALVMTPPLLTIVVGWWAAYPLERRIRESLLIRELDAGRPIHALPSRWQHVLLSVRHQLLLVLLPMTVLLTWHECVDAARRYVVRAYRFHDGDPTFWNRLAGWLHEPDTRQWITGGAQLVGVLLALVFLPVAMRLAWDTVPLGAGPMRDRLAAMCRACGVRVRHLLVWRTRGMMINGAVLGLVWRWRYILLTDALLEHLPERQVEAVMAHEIGHIRKAHIPWLIGGLLAIVMAVSVVAQGALWALHVQATEDQLQSLELGLALGGLVAAILGLGFISRRFEWQADAFAARYLSGGMVITPEGAGAMQDALRAVARLNAIPQHAFSFRHGSIAARVARLDAIIDRPVDNLPIDRTVRRVKWMIALGLAGSLGFMITTSI